MNIGPGITIGAGISYVESPALASVEYLVVAGGGGAVRIIWGANRAFPSTNTQDMS